MTAGSQTKPSEVLGLSGNLGYKHLIAFQWWG